MASKIVDKDRGFKGLLVAVRSAQGALAVGVDDTMREDGRLTNAQVAAIHEFGSGPVPARSFLRSWVDENQTGIQQSLRHWVGSALLGQTSAAGWTRKRWEDALAKFGEYCVKGVRAQIRKNIPPPLDPGTVKRKGHDLALVDTEQMYDAVTYEIDGRALPKPIASKAKPAAASKKRGKR